MKFDPDQNEDPGVRPDPTGVRPDPNHERPDPTRSPTPIPDYAAILSDQTRSVDLLKDEFIAIVSHELRTPLTSLRAALDLIARGAFASRPEKMKEMIDIAVRSTNRLLVLVNDIIDLESIESGRPPLRPATLHVADLFRLASALYPDSDIHISLPEGNLTFCADPDRILQALANLISNALKLSPPGTAVELAAKTFDDRFVDISVSDRGDGIPPERLAHVFERFHQVDASDSGAGSGSGLGLAICRTIVTQHGGRIWAISKAHEGTTFHFTLPIRPPG